jgi:hypothetical protein
VTGACVSARRPVRSDRLTRRQLGGARENAGGVQRVWGCVLDWRCADTGGQLRIDEYEFWTDGLQHVLSLRGYRRSRKAVSGFRIGHTAVRRRRVNQKPPGGRGQPARPPFGAREESIGARRYCASISAGRHQVESALAGHRLGDAAQSGSSCARTFRAPCSWRAPTKRGHLDGSCSRSFGARLQSVRAVDIGVRVRSDARDEGRSVARGHQRDTSSE